MSVATQTARAKLIQAKTFTVTEEAAPAVAGTEFSIAINSGAKKFTLRSRLYGELTISSSSGGNYFTIPKGASWSEDFVELISTTFYLKSTVANDIIELIEWV